MAGLGAVGRRLAYTWQGPPDLPRPLRLEWRMVAVRWAGICFVALGLAFLPLSVGRQRLAYGVLLFALVYNVAIYGLIRRKVPFPIVGFTTAVTDSALILLMLVSISNNFNSPFSYFLYSATVLVAMRYGYGPAMGTAAAYIVLDAANGMLHGQSLDPTFVFFAGFLTITAVLASYLREETSRAETALQERLRQANSFNEATAMLGATLEFEPLLGSVAAAASHLFGADCVALQPVGPLDVAGFGLPAAIFYPTPPDARRRELAGLCDRYVERHHLALTDGPQYDRDTLRSGGEAVVLALRPPTREDVLATLALALPQRRRNAALDPDVLASFAERSALAIESASLYRTLARNGDDLRRAYSDLASAHEALLSVDEMKTNFLTNVSHELRTPLTSIMSFSELLLAYDDPAVRQEFLQIINAESERLTRLVNDVLDVTKIESGHMEWHMTGVDLATLLRESTHGFAALLARRGLAFQQEISADLPSVCADPDRLQQVIANLLDNALKFTAQGQVGLRAWCADEEVCVAVADSGIGIPPEDQERIFEKFQQVGATLTAKPQGTGLGLAICRDIISHHRGRFWVQSQPGEGSTFIFTLPATRGGGDLNIQA